MIGKILIIEDEKLNADRLKRLIRTIRPTINFLGVLESVSETVEWFKNNDVPDVVMMDVRLSDGLSFEIFDQVNIECSIIFTTAYDEYALRAFKYDSVDYLLKPVEVEELELAFQKLERLGNQGRSMAGLLDFIKPKDYRNRFLLPYRDGYKTLPVSDISYFYSELKITRAKLTNGTEETIHQTMEELEQQLEPKYFFRANRQFIIHINSVQHVHNYFNGKLKIELKGSPEIEVIVSRDKSGPLKSWMEF